MRSVSSASSPHSDVIFDGRNSSLSETVSIGGTSAEETRPEGPRYSELE
jgi:hypothetical protein